MFNLIIILMTEFEEKFRQSEIFRISDYDFFIIYESCHSHSCLCAYHPKYK